MNVYQLAYSGKQLDDAIKGVGAGKRTAWYRPPDFPDYSSLNLSEDEAYAFFTFDTQIPVAEDLKQVTLNWYFYHNNGNCVNIDRGHIEDGAFVVDERVVSEGRYSSSATVDLPTGVGRFVVYRITATVPSDCVRQFKVTLGNKYQPCVETFIWNGGSPYAKQDAVGCVTVHTHLYTVHGCVVEGGTSEFWNNNISTPYAVVYDNVKNSNWGYLPFTNLGNACKAFYMTNSEWPMSSGAQNQFVGAKGLIMLDFAGSTITATNMSNCFSGCSSLRKLDLSNWIMEGVTNLTNAFSGMTSLVDLILPTMPKLSFNLSSSTLLSVDSLVNVIAALPDLDDGETATLTIGTTNTAKLAADQIAVATEKGWTVA